MADRGPSGSNGFGDEGELKLVRALRCMILRAHEPQMESILEKGKRQQGTVDKQQCTLAALEKHIAGGPLMPFTQATQPTEMTPQPEVISKFCQDVSDPRQAVSPASQYVPPLSSMEMRNIAERIGKVLTTSKSDNAVSKPRSRVAEFMFDVLSMLEEARKKHLPGRCDVEFIMSNVLKLLVGATIFLNSVFVLVQTDHSARNPRVQSPNFLNTFETVFIFAAELVLRIWVFRFAFFSGCPFVGS